MSPASRNRLTAPVLSLVQSQDWQLVYTVARHEKVVATHLNARGVEYSLPLYRTVHRRNKRAASVDLPLFPAYVFVHLNESNRRLVLTAPGVVRIVCFHGTPAVVPDEQIQAIQNALKFRLAHPCDYLAGGKRVRIMAGTLAGIVGVVDRVKGFRIIVSVDSISSSISIEANASDLELLSDCTPI
jgi:transcription antitermination factor NusG